MEFNSMIIDHICFAVKSLNEGIDYWGRIFGDNQMTFPVVNTRQKVKVVFLSKEGSLPVKLIEPVEGNNSLQNFVNRGGGFHHICFKCANVETTAGKLAENGLITLTPSQPGEAFNNHNIAFLLAKYGLNMELIDTDEKAALIVRDSRQ